VTSLPSDDSAARGIVRLLNTAGGRVLCLAGEVGAEVVDYFLRRYGREPARIDGIDAGSVTALSASALELVLDHIDAAGRAGRPLVVRASPQVGRLLAGAPASAPPPPTGVDRSGRGSPTAGQAHVRRPGP
jgi:hypothetical protein